MGRYFARRLTIATAGLIVTLAAGFGVEYGADLLGDALPVYSLLFLAGGLCGLLGIGFLGRIPEPRMAEPHHRAAAETARPTMPTLWRPTRVSRTE